ncbi:hypothetical protein M2263_004643 [Providencia alcalifaciens]|nr:hypothetical protein [Providencia alcalifaciens]
MNEQVSKALTDLLEKASSGIDSTVAFSQAQLPDVIHQLLAWKMTMGIIWSVVGVVLIALAIFICRYGLRELNLTALYGHIMMEKKI